MDRPAPLRHLLRRPGRQIVSVSFSILSSSAQHFLLVRPRSDEWVLPGFLESRAAKRKMERRGEAGSEESRAEGMAAARARQP